MTSQNADASKSEDVDVEARIKELQDEIKQFTLELEQCIADQADFRAKENFAERITFAKEIFTCQQDKLRLQVEIELLEKKIRRLQLGYAEDASPHTGQAQLFQG